MNQVEERFAEIKGEYAGKADISEGVMFGSAGLKVRGKVFAMLVKGELVVKLPADRASALKESGEAKAFDPGHGRVMKEWVAVPDSVAAGKWKELVTEAEKFVGR